MAQAFAKIHGSEKVEAYSAGSNPSGKINPKAVEAMADADYDLTRHQSKSLQEIPDEEFEYVVTMGCEDECAWVPARNREDWDIPDPRNMEKGEFLKIRDLIEQKVINLLNNVN